MWKDYSRSYIRNNRASGRSIMAAALIAALFLSLLCSMAYNLWAYEVERIVREEGDWQARIVNLPDEGAADLINRFANVERAVVNETLSQEETVIDIYFRDMREIYSDMPRIAGELGSGENDVFYHKTLLSRYFINDPQDEEPPLLLPFYLAVLFMASLSLILIIRSSFEISMNERIRQFGILSSVGASPGQIRTCLLQEAAALCLVPLLCGNVLGAAISYGVLEAANYFAAEIPGRHPAAFRYHPLIFLASFCMAALTVLLSAWIPARRLSRLTPLEAIRGAENVQLKRRRKARILPRLFGIEGELAGNALRAQRKSLWISTVSLLLSFLGFTAMLCFFTLSDISTQYTYFERYRDSWDVMVTVKDTDIEDFSLTEEVKGLPEANDCIVYEKTRTTAVLPKDGQSTELEALGGAQALAGTLVRAEGDFLCVPAAVVVMDDDSFLAYCTSIGAQPETGGAIILNRIWDSANSNFRYKKFIPFVSSDTVTAVLRGENGMQAEVPVLACTQENPVLREEYDNYSLVHFLPLSLWENEVRQVCEDDNETQIRIMAADRSDAEALAAVEETAAELIGSTYPVESENRIAERIANDRMLSGYRLILGSFCGLLAAIGIANVFSVTLGFLRLRKREFAQYLSVGLTPVNLRKVFFIEGFVIAGRPVLITLPLTAAATAFMISASHLEAPKFFERAPILPVLVFALFIVGLVALAYYIGGRRVLRCDLSEILKNDAVS